MGSGQSLGIIDDGRDATVKSDTIANKEVGSLAAGQRLAERVFCILSRHRKELFDRFGLDRLAVFGSTVRGDYRRGSDIDILVRFRPEKVKDFESKASDYYSVLFDVGEALSTVLNRKRLDVSDERYLDPRYRKSILAEAVDVPSVGTRFVFEKRGPMEKNVRKYFEDIHESCLDIRQFLQDKTLEEYQSDKMVRRAVERSLEIVGEALNKASKLESSVREDLPEAGTLVGLRNRLIHGYDSIIHPQIYQSVKTLLPELERKVAKKSGST